MDYANVVIGELRISPRQLYFRHVAACAIGFCNGAGLHRRGCGCWFALAVALQATGVVCLYFLIQGLVRIVAGDAADARIVADKAFAHGEPVRLNANERRTVPLVA